jgi:hypothetical protein
MRSAPGGICIATGHREGFTMMHGLACIPFRKKECEGKKLTVNSEIYFALFGHFR